LSKYAIVALLIVRDEYSLIENNTHVIARNARAAWNNNTHVIARNARAAWNCAVTRSFFMSRLLGAQGH